MAADLKDELKQHQEDERLKETQSGSEWTLTLFFFRMKAVMEHRRGTQRQFSEKYLFGRRFDI